MLKVAAPTVTAGRAPTRGAAAPPTRPATFITATTGNDVFWRAQAPAKVIGAKVLLVRSDKDAVRLFQGPNRSRVFPWSLIATQDGTDVELGTMRDWRRFAATEPVLARLRAEFPLVEGTAIFTRPCIARATLAKAMREEGRRTVAETDDNYFCDKSQNLFLRSNDYGAAGRDQHAKALASMDANIFSTVWLRDRYHREYRKRFGKKGLPEMHVCRNHVPRSAWPDRVERDGPLRVGFMGSTSHVWDINLAYAAFHAARAVGCETWMIGYNPADPEPGVPDTFTDEDGTIHQLRSEKSRAAITKWGKVISVHRKWVAPVDYHRAALPLDIGLAPLLWNDFTAGKSDVKAVEYTISGAACVLQNHPVYNSAGWVDGVNCLMGSDYESLARQTLRLVKDAKLRYDLVAAAQEMVARERNEEIMRYEWREAIQ